MAKILTKNIALSIHDMTRDKSGGELNNALENIVKYLAQKRMLSKWPEILKKLEEIMDKEEGIARAKISYKNIPTKKITDQIEELLKKRYKVKTIETEIVENKEILGGVKIEVGDEIIDLTLKNKLHQLQNYLITN